MILHTFITGVSHRPMSAQVLARNLEEGEELELEREPSNQFDANAIKVMKDEQCIGYIPAKHNADLAAHLDADGEYRCVVKEDGSTAISVEFDSGEEDDSE